MDTFFESYRPIASVRVCHRSNIEFNGRKTPLIKSLSLAVTSTTNVKLDASPRKFGEVKDSLKNLCVRIPCNLSRHTIRIILTVSIAFRVIKHRYRTPFSFGRLIRTHARSLAPRSDLPQHLALCTLNHDTCSGYSRRRGPLAASFPFSPTRIQISMTFSIGHKQR